jgi:hypothetical protein
MRVDRIPSDPAEENLSASCRKEASRAETDRERIPGTERDGEADVSSDSSIAGVGIRRLEWLLTVWPCSDVTDNRPATTNAPKNLMASLSRKCRHASLYTHRTRKGWQRFAKIGSERLKFSSRRTERTV